MFTCSEEYILNAESQHSEASITWSILQALEYEHCIAAIFINSIKIMSNNIHVTKRNPC